MDLNPARVYVRGGVNTWLLYYVTHDRISPLKLHVVLRATSVLYLSFGCLKYNFSNSQMQKYPARHTLGIRVFGPVQHYPMLVEYDTPFDVL